MKTLRSLVGVCLLLCLISLPVNSQDKPKRGPSTPQERQAAVEIATYLENNPLAKDAKDKRTALMHFLIEVPDISVSVCPAIFGPAKEFKGDYETELVVQSAISQAKFIILNPEKAKDKDAVHLAGAQGTLTAWKAIKTQKPKAKFKLLDSLLEKEQNGTLIEFLKANVSNCN